MNQPETRKRKTLRSWATPSTKKSHTPSRMHLALFLRNRSPTRPHHRYRSKWCQPSIEGSHYRKKPQKAESYNRGPMESTWSKICHKVTHISYPNLAKSTSNQSSISTSKPLNPQPNLPLLKTQQHPKDARRDTQDWGNKRAPLWRTSGWTTCKTFQSNTKSW